MSIYSQLQSYALNYAKNSIISGCAIGENCLAVESGPGCGMAFVERDFWRIMPSQGEIRALENKVCGMRLDELIAMYEDNNTVFSGLAFAAINSAFSAGAQHTGEFDLPAALVGRRRMGMVGCFHPLMPHVRKSGIELVLFELQKMPGTHSPEEAPDLLPGCDILVITASTFVNRTFHLYLPHISPEAEVYIMGPSTPLSADLAERFNLAGSLVSPENRDKVFDNVRRGYSYRALSPWLRKVIVPHAGKAAA